MSDQVKELLDIPRDFFKDGTQFINRCTKPDQREFIKISQAVGIGFIVMGTIGYFVKLSKLVLARSRDLARFVEGQTLTVWLHSSHPRKQHISGRRMSVKDFEASWVARYGNRRRAKRMLRRKKESLCAGRA